MNIIRTKFYNQSLSNLPVPTEAATETETTKPTPVPVPEPEIEPEFIEPLQPDEIEELENLTFAPVQEEENHEAPVSESTEEKETSTTATEPEEENEEEVITDDKIPIIAKVLVDEDVPCPYCNEKIKAGDMIQFDDDGNCHHTDCKFGFGEVTFVVDETPETQVFESAISPGVCMMLNLRTAHITGCSTGKELERYLVSYDKYLTEKAKLEEKVDNLGKREDISNNNTQKTAPTLTVDGTITRKASNCKPKKGKKK